MTHVRFDSQLNNPAWLSGFAELKAATICDPSELLKRHDFTRDEKRTLLASWASDARALEHAPNLRQLDSGALVPVSDILMALKALDEQHRFNGNREFGRLLKFRRKWSDGRRLGRRDDDDDPPAAPAAAMPIPRRPSGNEAVALAICA